MRLHLVHPISRRLEVARVGGGGPQPHSHMPDAEVRHRRKRVRLVVVHQGIPLGLVIDPGGRVIEIGGDPEPALRDLGGGVRGGTHGTFRYGQSCY